MTGAQMPLATEESRYRATAGQKDEARPILDLDLAADDELDAVLLSGKMSAHHARHRALVGDGKGGVAQACSSGNQFLGMGGATQEGEVAEAVDLGVGGITVRSEE